MPQASRSQTSTAARSKREGGPLVVYERNASNSRLEALLPLHIHSEGNSTDHWRLKHARHKKQRQWVHHALRGHGLALPASVTMTRLAPRTLDSDNLIFGLKWLRDAVAAELCYDYRPGLADSSPLIAWNYAQAKSPRYGVLLIISSLSALKSEGGQDPLPSSDIISLTHQGAQIAPCAFSLEPPAAP